MIKFLKKMCVCMLVLSMFNLTGCKDKKERANPHKVMLAGIMIRAEIETFDGTLNYIHIASIEDTNDKEYWHMEDINFKYPNKWGVFTHKLFEYDTDKITLHIDMFVTLRNGAKKAYLQTFDMHLERGEYKSKLYSIDENNQKTDTVLLTSAPILGTNLYLQIITLDMI